MEIAINSLEKARNYLKEGNYGRSFAHYLVLLQLIEKDDRESFENEFKLTWFYWQNILFEREEFENVLKCFSLTYNYYPGLGIQEIYELGLKLLSAEKFLEAKKFFEAILSKNPNFLPAEINLRTAKYALVERWHFRMLNDLKRNKSYLDAIKGEIKRTKDNREILDIGTGTGILGLFGAQNCGGGTNVTACDDSEAMIKVAREILKRNESGNKIQLVKEHSTRVKGRFLLVVTEILDSGIFGEGILETLSDAWDRLLVEGGKIIPSRVEIFVTAISSPKISPKSRLKPNITVLNLNDLCITSNSEPYDTENLKKIPYTFITDIQKALDVNFNSPIQLKSLLKSTELTPTTKLTCTKPSQIDAFALWFNLYLTDKIFITNDPRNSEFSCWEQAIINLAHPFKLNAGDSLEFKISAVDGVLKICEMCPSEPQNTFSEAHKCYKLDKADLIFLNDEILLKKFENLSQKLSVRGKNVLDLSSVPIFGLLCLKYGANLFLNVKDSIKDLTLEICRRNNLDFSKINFLTESKISVATTKFDLIFQNLIENSGLLSENEIKMRGYWSKFLKSDEYFLPRIVNVWAKLIYCDWLETVTKVNDQNCCGIKIAEIINEYKTTEQRDIDLGSLDFTEFSFGQKIGSIKQFETSKLFEDVVEVSILRNGSPNAILYWFEIDFWDSESIFTDRENSFANVAALMIDDEDRKIYQKDEKCLLILKQQEGFLKISI